MPRFNLGKGDRFQLKKDEGLNHIKAVIGWGKGSDLDVSAFLVNEDGVITNDADFVFYNSENREKPFDKETYGNKKIWRRETRPVSADGSVLGSIDDRGGRSGEEDKEPTEEMHVILDKVGGKIAEIVFCVTINDPGKTFKDVQDPYISIVDEDKDEELCRYDLNEKFSNETAVVAASLICDEEGEWTFEAQGKGYEGGLETLIDIYAS